MPVAGRPLLEWSLGALRAAPSVTAIAVAVPPGVRGSHGEAGQTANAVAWDGVRTVDGGATRAESVANALATVETGLVAIHDAARPLLTADLLEGVVATLLADPGADGAIAAAPVADTLKRADEAGVAGETPVSDNGTNVASIAETVDRSGLWAAQTPQVFRVEALRRALAAAGERAAEATDEAMLVEWAGGRVLLHEVTTPNPKLTTPADLRLVEGLLAR